MVAETSTHAKTFNKRRGLKRVFSVPVGKLRSKLNTPGRNGSSSKSGSSSVSHHKVLLRNNRDLARALSIEKEKYRGMVTENVNLKARLHETRLEVHGLENKLSASRQSLTVYQNAIRDHLGDAVKHSVSLTESLKLAMGLCFTESKDTDLLRNIVSGCSVPSSASQPQRLRVNPMVSGHTIRHPTISLKRVEVNSENRNADRDADPNENQIMEIVDDDSQSMEGTQERPGGLSTCLEEDEEDSIDDTNQNESDGEEEESGEDDSIKRKVVSFRNTTLDKDKNRSQLEVGEDSPSNEMCVQKTMELTSAEQVTEQVTAQNSKIPHNYKQPQIPEKLHVPDYISKRNPVVALNDISRFLQNSNSVNVQKVLLDIDNCKSAGKVGCRALEGSSNGKENCPKPAPMELPVPKQLCASSRIETHLVKGTSKQCMEGSIETNSLPDSQKSNTDSNNADVQATRIPCIEEDPLEGTSWMHLHLFSEKKKRPKCADNRNFSKETSQKVSNSKMAKVSSDKNDSKENISQGLGTDLNRLQEDSEIIAEQMKETTDECDVSDFEVGLKNCPAAQSTPMNFDKPSQNSSASCASDVSKTSSKSSRDGSFSKSCDSSGDSCSQGNNQMKEKEKEKNIAVALVDTKVDGKPFVTLRAKKLTLHNLSPTNSLPNNLHEVDNNANQMCDEGVKFLGFGDDYDAEEAIKELNCITASRNELESRDIVGSCSAGGSSMLSGSVTYNSRYCSEGDSCNVLADDATTSGRPKRRAAPKELKEPRLNKKLRRESTGKKSKKKKQLVGNPV